MHISKKILAGGGISTGAHHGFVWWRRCRKHRG